MTVYEPNPQIPTEGIELSITSANDTLSARHFPAAHNELASTQGRPCIVMAHGLGATQDSGLTPFAQAFAAAGAEVITFDYRHFAGSDGEPRQLVSIKGQLRDYQSVVACARRMRNVDADRVYL